MVGLKNAVMSKAIEASLAKANELSELKSDPIVAQPSMTDGDVASDCKTFARAMDQDLTTPTTTPARVTRRHLPKIDRDFDYETDDFHDQIISQKGLDTDETLHRRLYKKVRRPAGRSKNQWLPQSLSLYNDYRFGVMEQTDVRKTSMMNMSRQEFAILRNDEVSKQLSSWIQNESTTVHEFPRSYSHDEIDEEIFHTLCVDGM